MHFIDVWNTAKDGLELLLSQDRAAHLPFFLQRVFEELKEEMNKGMRLAESGWTTEELSNGAGLEVRILSALHRTLLVDLNVSLQDLFWLLKKHIFALTSGLLTQLAQKHLNVSTL